uniref:RS1_1 n=1 Tax=Human herpesvirus 2 TaxID=10310 RepID=A0A2U9DVX5_HHV2|nr:RS1_1 [Human alphaherpesvirus 2]
MSPREYRRAVLPALDGRAAASGAGDAMAPGAPDFCEDEAHSHRACARWGLGAPLRPVYVALGRDAVRGGPAELRGPRREFCARALLEPDGDAPPLVLRDDADAGPPPQIRWASAAGRAGTVLAAAGGGVGWWGPPRGWPRRRGASPWTWTRSWRTTTTDCLGSDGGETSGSGGGGRWGEGEGIGRLCAFETDAAMAARVCEK